MFDRRSSKKELIDGSGLDDAALARNLRELEGVNRWLGGKTTLISALDRVYDKHSRSLADKTVSIADVGCGGGDLLRAVHHWAQAKRLNTHLIGIDANPFMIQYALRQSQAFSTIQLMNMNVFSDTFKTMRFDIVCLNTFCHHLSDPDLVTLLKQLAKQTSTAIIVNDLHRHWLAYLSIKWISRFLDFSYLARHDGPLSVLRAFRKDELTNLIELAQIDCHEIRWRWAFRWEAILWKK